MIRVSRTQPLLCTDTLWVVSASLEGVQIQAIGMIQLVRGCTEVVS